MAKNWSNASGGNWSNALNWAQSSIPGDGDSVTFATGSYTSVIDTGFQIGTALDDILLSPTVILDVRQSVTINRVIGSSSTDGSASTDGLLEVGNGAVLTYTANGDFNNRTLYVKSDGIGARGEVIFTAASFGIDFSSTITMDGVNFDARAIVDPTAVVILENGATFTAVGTDAFNDGTIALSGAVANLANIGDLSNSTGNAADQIVQMAGATQDELLLPNSALGKGLTIENYGLGDMVGIAGITTVKSATYDASHNLNFYASTNGTGTPLATLTGLTLDSTLNPPATLDPAFFSIVTNPTGTFVELIACFAEGTRIATVRGMVAVEALRKGDQVRTLRGGLQPIVWLGHRRIDCRRHRDPAQVWPVRIVAGAFGPGRPYRDLVLSPDHALFVGGVLIPVRYLENGRTIRQEPCDEVTYWHVELPAHNVLYAEGVPAESYLDTGNRSAFANGGIAVDLHPDFSWRVWEARGFAPLVLNGPWLAKAKQRLLARASMLGHCTTNDPDLRILANGRELSAERNGQTWQIHLPKSTCNVRLRSRAWVPAHSRADTDDTRHLGVAVARLQVDGREAGLDASNFCAGWHAPENHWRWSDGNASFAVNGARSLSFDVVMSGRYWQDQESDTVRAA